jgi:hypothetical protein
MLALRFFGLTALLMMALSALPFGPQAGGRAVAQEPEKAVQPPSGSPGTTFAFFATGLGGNDQYVYWATSPDGTVYGRPEYRTQSFRGRADWTWTAPADARPGIWTMLIRRPEEDDDTDREKDRKQREAVTIPFEIVAPGGQPSQPAPPPDAQPDPVQQAVQPALGAAGTEFAFFATGFDADERVGYWVNAPNGEIISDDEGYTSRANRDGRADWRWASRDTATPGFYSMVARGVESGVERVIAFEIR